MEEEKKLKSKNLNPPCLKINKMSPSVRRKEGERWKQLLEHPPPFRLQVWLESGGHFPGRQRHCQIICIRYSDALLMLYQHSPSPSLLPIRIAEQR
ncbi:hypothetical protein CEXT_350301 [Caerostris extrusa]|uniref:Ycf15 n=1 Tax=Caerostris extrusa TaxID=172846 RepID=A0AAV4Y3S2_CAEEX|nr:hypothetical protein CEXT_350301 [Caerostris extrusa]